MQSAKNVLTDVTWIDRLLTFSNMTYSKKRMRP
jgi:hypothetical protein